MTAASSREADLDALDAALLEDARKWEEIGRDHQALAKRLLTQNDGRAKKDLGVVSNWATEYRAEIKREELAAENAFKQALKIREAIIGAKKRGPAPKGLASDAPAKARDPATQALIDRRDRIAAEKLARKKVKIEDVTPEAESPTWQATAIEPLEG